MNLEMQLKLAKNTPYYEYLGIEVVEADEGFASLGLTSRTT